jgi:hypothetical protein
MSRAHVRTSVAKNSLVEKLQFFPTKVSAVGMLELRARCYPRCRSTSTKRSRSSEGWKAVPEKQSSSGLRPQLNSLCFVCPFRRLAQAVQTTEKTQHDALHLQVPATT